MGKECGARLSRRLWGGSNTSPLKTTAWEASFRKKRKEIRGGAQMLFLEENVCLRNNKINILNERSLSYEQCPSAQSLIVASVVALPPVCTHSVYSGVSSHELIVNFSV